MSKSPSSPSEFWQHESAIVDLGAVIGSGTKIWHFTHICGSNVTIGRNCSLGQNVYVGPNTKIGNGCRVQNNVSIYDLVELGDYVFCGPSMVFTNVINPRAHVPRKEEFRTTKVARGVTFGANSTIVCGVSIGEFAFIAAGAVVTKDVPPFGLMVGVPAHFSGWMCHCGVAIKSRDLNSPYECAACRSRYLISDSECRPLQLHGMWKGLNEDE
ncbi:MAG: acyltransferase [Bdellovibrionales bacterium]